MTWRVSDSSAATISSTGKLTAKTVVDEKTVTVTAQAKDGGGAIDERTVLIKPKAGLLRITLDNNVVTSQTLYRQPGETLMLTASRYGDIGVLTPIWKSSSSAVARVTADGKVTLNRKGTAVISVKAAGRTASITVTVTCTAADGSGRYAFVRIKVIR